MDLKQEQRICIKFCQKIGKTATETVDLIKLAFGMNSLSQSRVFEWFARFRDGRGTTEDDLHTGRPIASRTAERVEEISNLIIKDRRISVNKGLIHIEFLPNGQTVNQHVYLNILRHLRESLRKKRPEKWASGDWVLHHDKAPPHRALFVASFMAKNNMITLHHPPYSPDMAPSDFFLFPLLKSVLKGRRFETTEEIKEESLRVLKRITSDQFSSCFLNWAKRMKRCVDAQGEYFEEY